MAAAVLQSRGGIPASRATSIAVAPRARLATRFPPQLQLLHRPATKPAVAAAAAAARTPRPSCLRSRPPAAPLPPAPPPQACAPVKQRDTIARSAGAGAAAAGGVPAPGADEARGLFVRKVAALALIFLGATINYTILQNLRDAIVVTSCGAEALPFINGFLVLPASLALFVYYDRLVAAKPAAKAAPGGVFTLALAPLAAFFALFAAVLLPNAAALQPTAAAASLAAALPEGLGVLVRVAANWAYTLFFVAGELWGSMAISLLFWSLADDVCSVDEAASLYPKLGIAANIGLVLAGAFTRAVNGKFGASAPTLAVQLQLAGVLCMCAVMVAAKSFIDARVAPQLKAAAEAAGGGSSSAAARKKKGKKEKEGAEGGAEGGKKPSTWDILRSSPRIRDVALMVMGYGVANKLYGWSWKAEMRNFYPDASSYSTVMGDVASWTGIATIALMLVSKWTFQLLRWRGAALATPIVMALAGGTFFAGSVLARAGGGAGAATAGTAAAALVAAASAAGLVCQVFGRASKYSLFDPCKEIIFITMDKREKELGKAAVDVVGNQIGKSGGAFVMQALVLLTGSMAAAMPFTGVVFGAVIVVWAGAAARLAATAAPDRSEAVAKTIDQAPALEPPLPQKIPELRRSGAGSRPASPSAAAVPAAAAAATAVPAAAPAAAPPPYELSAAAAAEYAAAAAAAAVASNGGGGAPSSDDDDEAEVLEAKASLQSHFD